MPSHYVNNIYIIELNDNWGFIAMHLALSWPMAMALFCTVNVKRLS